MRSELADVFAKTIEKEPSLFKEAYPFNEEYTEKGKDKSDVGNKKDEQLYNLKHKDAPYDYNIIEQVHKETVVIHPSYDKINGVIENGNESSSIIQNLVLNKPVGLLAKTKYASQELTLELVKIANEMDANSNEELYKLADQCLLKISKEQDNKLNKKAWIWFALGGAALAATWLASHVDNVSHGILVDCDEAVKKLQDLKEKSFWESDVDDEVKSTADKLINLISEFKSQSDKYIKLVSDFKRPRTKEELEKYLPQLKEQVKEDGGAVYSGLMDYKRYIENLYPMIVSSIDNFSDSSYQDQHQNASFLGTFTGWIGEALHGAKGLIANDFTSAANALGTLKKSMEEMMKATKQIPNVIQNFENQIKQSVEAAESKAKSTDNPKSKSRPFSSHSEEDEGILNKLVDKAKDTLGDLS